MINLVRAFSCFHILHFNFLLQNIYCFVLDRKSISISCFFIFYRKVHPVPRGLVTQIKHDFNRNFTGRSNFIHDFSIWYILWELFHVFIFFIFIFLLHIIVLCWIRNPVRWDSCFFSIGQPRGGPTLLAAAFFARCLEICPISGYNNE